jgi:hypothetical protein
LLITLPAGAAALALGFIGFSQQEPSWSALNRLYAAVELFRLYTDSRKPPNNIYLEVARWLAPMTVGYAAVLAFAQIFRKQWIVFRTRFTHDHVVICGLGRCGIRLARSFRKSREHRAVVVIDRNPTIADKRECDDLGVRMFIGDARDVAVLDQAGLRRAGILIAVCGNDAVDSEVASAALSLLAKGKRTSLRCFIHIGDHMLAEQLEKLALEVPTDEEAQLSQLEWFNVYDIGPTALLNSDADLLKPKEGRSPHIIVVGAGVLGRNLLIEAARRWSVGQHPMPIRITLVAKDAEDQCRTLNAEFAHLRSVSDLVAVSFDAANIRSADELRIELPSAHTRTKAFVCLEEDDECLRATIQIRETLPEDVEVVTCTTGSSGVATFLRNKTGGLLSRVQEFALLEIALTPEVLLNTIKEQIAQALHKDYYDNRSGHPLLEDARVHALVPWQLLPESFKHANRAKASSIGVQLDQFGFKIVRNYTWNTPAFPFDETQVEELAESEHQRWRKEKEGDGWRVGTPRDDEKKVNPYLVDWNQLPTAIQDLDRSFARRLPTILATVGYSVVRKDGSSSGVKTGPVAASR